MNLSNKEITIITNIFTLESILCKAAECADEAVEHLAKKNPNISNIDAAIGAILDIEALLEHALSFYKTVMYLRRNNF